MNRKFIQTMVLTAMALILAFGAATSALALSPSDIANNKSAYFIDPQNVHVEERSAEALKTVNQILCMISLTAYDKLLNYDPNNTGTPQLYGALIDGNMCSQDRDSVQSSVQSASDQTSGANAPNFMTWYVRSMRASTNQPQYLYAWINQKENFSVPNQPTNYKFPVQIRAQTAITESASTDNPYGQFSLYFKMYQKFPGTVPSPSEVYDVASGANSNLSIDPGKSFARGYLTTAKDSSGKVILQFLESDDYTQLSLAQNSVPISTTSGGSSLHQLTMQRSPDGSSGAGSTYLSDPGNTPSAFNFAYNSDYFLRSSGSDTVCLDRNHFKENVWQYGVYKSDGSRVSVNGGFPFNATSDNASGWVGYYGVNMADRNPNPGGTPETVHATAQDGSSATYTIYTANGKLTKHVRQILALGDLRDLPLSWYNNGTNYQVIWNGAQFTVQSKQNTSTYNWDQPSGSDPTSIPMTGLNWQNLMLYSNGMGGNINVNLSCTQTGGGIGTPPTFSCSASDASQVVFYQNTAVYPGDSVPTSLACFVNCPNPYPYATTHNSNGTPATNPANPYYYGSMNGWNNVAPTAASASWTYTFDPTGYTLSLASRAGVAITQPAYINYASAGGLSGMVQNGIQSGALVDLSQTANQTAMECTDQYGTPQAGTTCGWNAGNLPVYYTWETGPNTWNKLATLKQGSTYLRFDPPVQLTYNKQGSDGTYTQYFLQYAGFGQLQGIPGTCYDRDTGQEKACDGNSRWVPQFSLPDGAEVCTGTYTGTSCSGTAYLVKGLQKEYQMQEASAGSCSGLSLTSYALPDLTSFVDFTLPSPKPKGDSNDVWRTLYTNPPLVINGVVQK